MEFSIRPATLSDYDDVMNIDKNVFLGFGKNIIEGQEWLLAELESTIFTKILGDDYLGEVYATWIHHSNRLNFVIVSLDSVIGYVSVSCQINFSGGKYRECRASCIDSLTFRSS